MLQTLEITNFRSYTSGLFGFEPGVNIVVGPNASGKTNLLEAIHVIATGSSFHAPDKDLIKIGEEWSRLEAMTEKGQRVVKLRLNGPKQIELDGVTKTRLMPHTQIPVVVFEPDHMLLLAGEPERRRAYLDTILSLSKTGYRQALLAYRRALSQRNRVLKDDRRSMDELFVWDVQLAERAGIIAAARLDLVHKLQDKVQQHYQTISTSTDGLQLTYDITFPVAQYSDRLLAHLRSSSVIDRQRGFTGTGPHREDLLVALKGADARQTASRGERRSIILALKIRELELLYEQTGTRPILLLDDVFSELDGRRRRALAESLVAYQTFLTTTDADVAVDHFSNYNIIPMG